MLLHDLFRKPTITQVSPDQIKEKQQAGAIIVDIRERYEWADGHIPGAVHIPLGSLSKRLQELNASKEIITVSRNGLCSNSAAVLLQRAGFTQVSSMAGGMGIWMAHGYPVSTK